MSRQMHGGMEATPFVYTVDLQTGEGFLPVVEGAELVAFDDEEAAVAHAAAVAERTGRATRVWRRHERELGHTMDLVREIRPTHGPHPPVS